MKKASVVTCKEGLGLEMVSRTRSAVIRRGGAGERKRCKWCVSVCMWFWRLQAWDDINVMIVTGKQRADIRPSHGKI